MATVAAATPSTKHEGGGGRRTVHRHAQGVLAATCALLLASLAWTAGAWAAATNDDFAAATTIAALPFAGSVDMTGTTSEPSEPQFCNYADQTVWYAFTATQDGKLAADTAGSPAPFSQVSVYRQDGSGLGGLSFLSCQNFGPGKAVFDVQAGTTYYIQVSILWGFGGTLQLHLNALLPPANDDFAHATVVGSTPFSDSVDLTGATVQTDEPTTCQGISSPATAWYSFTPTVSGSYRAFTSGFFYGRVAAYTGSSLASLSQLACGGFGTYFHADAGTTYYLQVDNGGGSGGPLQFSLDVAPPAQASFYYWPSDPSSLDNVSFYDYSYDPAGIGSRSWNLGDGFTSTDCCLSHRYVADGDYSARLDITTTDGRTASATQTVPVKTHDVSITQFKLPSSGKVGRSRQLSVEVNNSRYAETVQVAILRSVPGGGFEQVGQVTQNLPARSSKRTTSFAISYTFSPQDAVLGKVSFEAVATLISARDANPADNTVISVPLKVAA